MTYSWIYDKCMQKEFVCIERAIILIFISKKNTLLVFIFEQQKNINCAKKVFSKQRIQIKLEFKKYYMNGIKQFGDCSKTL